MDKDTIIHSFSVGNGNFEVIQSGTDLVVADAGTGGGKKQLVNYSAPISYAGLVNALNKNTQVASDAMEKLGFSNLLRNANTVHVNISHKHMDHINLLPHVIYSIDKENANRIKQKKSIIQIGSIILGGTPYKDMSVFADKVFDAVSEGREKYCDNLKVYALSPLPSDYYNGDGLYNSTMKNCMKIYNNGEKNKQEIAGMPGIQIYLPSETTSRKMGQALTVYAPTEGRNNDQNDNSNIALFRNGSNWAVFNGDATSRIQKEQMLFNHALVTHSSQPHHGSKHNVLPSVLADNRTSVINSGRKKQYHSLQSIFQKNIRSTSDGTVQTRVPYKKPQLGPHRHSALGESLYKLLYSVSSRGYPIPPEYQEWLKRNHFYFPKRK